MAGNTVRIHAVTKDDASGPIDKIRDRFEKLRAQGAKGLAIGAGAAIAAKGLEVVGSALGNVAGFFGDARDAAVNLDESINAVNVVFGKGAAKIHAYGETAAESAGLSKRAFNQLVTPIGAMLQNVGFSADQAAESSINLAQRAADMASVFNVDVSEALSAIQAGLRGENDPLERFGVGLSAAAVEAHAMELGLADANGELSNSAKAQARLSLIMQQTNKVAGDFANTSDGLANQERINAALWEDTSAKLGKVLVPAFIAVGNVVRNVVIPAISKASDVAAGVATAIGAVVKAVDFLKPGLIALGFVVTATMIPALIGMGTAAAAAGAAMIVAFAPVVIPLAAITAAVVAVSVAANQFAMDFGDMGTKIHDIADRAKTDFTEVKDWIRDRMAETGESFEEAAKAAEIHFGTLPKTAKVSGQEMTAELHSQLMAAKGVAEGSGIADAVAVPFEEGKTRAVVAMEEMYSSIAQVIAERENELRQAGGDAVKAWLDPQMWRNQAEIVKGELVTANEELLEAQKNGTAAEIAEAKNRVAALTAEAIELQQNLATVGTDMEQAAAISSIRQSQFMRDGLRSEDDEIRAIFEAWDAKLAETGAHMEQEAIAAGGKTTQGLTNALERGGKDMHRAFAVISEDAAIAAHGAGRRVGVAWANGLRSAKDYARLMAWEVAAAAKPALHGLSPPKEGPLKDIDKGAFNIGKAWANGLAKAGGLARLGAHSMAGDAAGGLSASGGAGGAPVVIQLQLDGRTVAEVVDRALYYDRSRAGILPRN